VGEALATAAAAEGRPGEDRVISDLEKQRLNMIGNLV
jgi:hypothetical protein